eukprot:7242655-Alexandrium_andersonii.AAC.1
MPPRQAPSAREARPPYQGLARQCRGRPRLLRDHRLRRLPHTPPPTQNNLMTAFMTSKAKR